MAVFHDVCLRVYNHKQALKNWTEWEKRRHGYNPAVDFHLMLPGNELFKSMLHLEEENPVWMSRTWRYVSYFAR